MADKPTPTDAELFALIKEHLGLDQRRDDTVINRSTGRFHDAQRYRDFAAAVLAIAKWGQPAQARADAVLYDPKAVLDVFNSARAGSEKPVGYLRGILAVIAHWESRPEPHRWMLPERADSVLEDAERHFFDAGWKACANFCDRDDVVADGIIGFGACPQFEAAFSAARARLEGKP